MMFNTGCCMCPCPVFPHSLSSIHLLEEGKEQGSPSGYTCNLRPHLKCPAHKQTLLLNIAAHTCTPISEVRYVCPYLKCPAHKFNEPSQMIFQQFTGTWYVCVYVCVQGVNTNTLLEHSNYFLCVFVCVWTALQS